jgi:uncharacterized membrane protein YraQ (UPF0718 family)
MRLIHRTVRTATPRACACAGPVEAAALSGGCCPASPGSSAPPPLRDWVRKGLPAAALGILAYVLLEPLTAAFTSRVLGLSLDSRLGSAVAFLLLELPKVILLLAGVTFVIGFGQTFLRPERIRQILARRGGALGNLLASLFGIITPFCSCSAVPLFIGLVRVGVPLGVTFSYLVAAPMINEVALVLLLAMFGWKIAALYAGTGLAVALVSGLVMGRLGMERQVESWVLAERQNAGPGPARSLSLEQRLDEARASAWEIVRKVWPAILLGLTLGAGIHGYVPEGLMAGILGKQAWWSVPLAVLIGVPLYASTAVILPIVQTLLAKGAALGTVLAFMMAVTALSLPETIILRKVLKVRLIAVFLTVVAGGILAVGYLFNILL